MRTFLVFMLVPWAALFTWALLPWVSWPIRGERNIAVFALIMVAAPGLCAWLTTEVLALWRPRRVFEAGPHRTVPRIALGLVCGALGCMLTAAALLAGAERVMHDALVTGASSLLSAALVVAMLPRSRPGTCVGCGYDLKGVTARAGGVCPECGRPLT